MPYDASTGSDAATQRGRLRCKRVVTSVRFVCVRRDVQRWSDVFKHAMPADESSWFLQECPVKSDLSRVGKVEKWMLWRRDRPLFSLFFAQTERGRFRSVGLGEICLPRSLLVSRRQCLAGPHSPTAVRWLWKIWMRNADANIKNIYRWAIMAKFTFSQLDASQGWLPSRIQAP